MKIIDTYSFKGGGSFIKANHPNELKDIFEVIKAVDAIACLTKESKEATRKMGLLFSAVSLNDALKEELFDRG